MDKAALDALLESLSSNATFTDQLKAGADSCIVRIRVNTTLTAKQQGVFVLACMKLLLVTECALENENAKHCLNAITLMKCPVGIHSLVDHRAVRSCKKDTLVSAFAEMPDSFSAESFVDSACAMIEKGARRAAKCSLQAAGLASGDSMDLAAVETAIFASTVTTDSEKARQQGELDNCRDSGADTVDAFLDCWARRLAGACIKFSAARLSTAPNLPGPEAGHPAEIKADPEVGTKDKAGPGDGAKLKTGPGVGAKVDAGPGDGAKLKTGPEVGVKVKAGPGVRN